jgi:acetyl esterase/lipase
MVGSAKAYKALLGHLALAADAACLSFDYRLAPESPFPTAIEDCLSVYQQLLAQRRSEQIAFAGDSAGGGLVFATMLRARDLGVPLPAAGYGLSVWGDLGATGGPSRARLRRTP